MHMRHEKYHARHWLGGGEHGDACHRRLPGSPVKGAHRLPVRSNLVQPNALADVHQVQNVLLKAGAAKAHARVQELGPDARVRADGMRHLRDTPSTQAQGATAWGDFKSFCCC